MLRELVRGDPHRLGQQPELATAERVQQRAPVVGAHVAGYVGEHPERDAHGQDGQVPRRNQDQIPALPDHQGGQRDPGGITVMAADVQGPETRREQQGQDEPGRNEVPPQFRPPAGGPGARLPGPGRERGDGHDRHADQAMRALPVAAADLVHDPRKRPGQEAERPGDRGPGLVEVGEDSRARGQGYPRGQVHAGDVQQGRDGGEGQGTGQRVITAEHVRAPRDSVEKSPAVKLRRHTDIHREPRRAAGLGAAPSWAWRPWAPWAPYSCCAIRVGPLAAGG